MKAALFPTFAIALLATGCQPPAAAPPEAAPAPLAAGFDVKKTGTIRGRVVWTGKAPDVEPLKLLVKVHDFDTIQPNPNALAIDPKTGGMGQVLVYLRKVDLAHAQPWSHAAVEVAFEKQHLAVRQGESSTRIGIVRRGNEVAFVSREKRNHLLQGRGANVFAIPLAEPDTITRRKLEHPGIVELSSGSAYFWMRGYLWVGEHPYAVVTDAAGEFALPQVRAGDYELVCWSPHGRIKRRERHPEFGEIERLIFEDAVERSLQVSVVAGATVTPTFRWSEADFAVK